MRLDIHIEERELNDGMKLFRLILLGAMVVLAGCEEDMKEEVPADNKAMNAESADTDAGGQKMTDVREDAPVNADADNAAGLQQSLPLSFKPIDVPKQALSLRDSADSYTTIKTIKLQRGDIEIYRKASDEEQVYAAIIVDSKVYEIGEIGNAVAAGDLYSAADTAAFSGEYMKVTGGVGANAPIAYYITIEKSTPSLLVRIDGHTVESDADGDGSYEIISTVGTAAETTIYQENADRIEAFNINEALRAQVVLYDSSANLFLVYAKGADESFTQWKMEDSTLELLPQKNENFQ